MIGVTAARHKPLVYSVIQNTLCLSQAVFCHVSMHCVHRVVCVCTGSRGNFNFVFGGPNAVLGAMKPDPPPLKHTLMFPLPTQHSELRHMWKQFSRCPEQANPHTL